MQSVLTYNPKSNKVEFLTFTEKTIHTKHKNMYEIVTRSGHKIKVTDDHSLATVGTDTFFDPLPPEKSLNKFVPILAKVDYHVPETDIKNIDSLVELMLQDALILRQWMLNLPASIIYPYIFCALDRRDWKYNPESNDDKELFKVLLARIGFSCEEHDGYIECVALPDTLIPEDGKLIKRSSARTTNPYLRLPFAWSEIISVTKVPREEVTYDFTVPDFPLFIGNSILVYDTMQLHVPVTEEARTEALKNMLPSKNLFSARTLDPMMLPQQESIYGLFEASKPAKGKAITVTDVKSLRKSIEDDVIKPNAPVNYKNIHTTAGIALINESLPENLRDYKSQWDKKFVQNKLKIIGRKKPNLYAQIADDIKELGALYAYKMGCSFKASDFDLSKEHEKRNKMLSIVDKELSQINKSKLSPAEKYKNKVVVLRKAQKFDQVLTDNAKNNTFHKWAYSGSRGDPGQVMQILVSPTIVADPRDNVVPIPIRRSYLEGISPADYWVSSYGTRKGVISAKLSVAPGGALAKEIIGNVLDIVISTHDCGTKKGIEIPVTAEHRKDIVERYEAGTNKFIDDIYFENLLKRKVKSIMVRSPMTCKAAHGVCQLCFGHNEKGLLPEIGENVGVVAAQAVTEPLTQMGLSSKHSAGTAAAEKVGLSTIKHFFNMPNTFAGAALVSEVTGKVTKIEPGVAGGTDVHIGRKKYHAAPGITLKVKLGDMVNAGDIISTGVPNLKKIVPYKGIYNGRETFVHSAYDLYNRAGAPSIQKNFETIARGLVNYVRIETPGSSGLVEGDVVDFNELMGEIEEGKRKHKSYVPPTYKPVQSGTTYAPQNKPDWLANFGFKYLKKNIIENAASGVKSFLHSYNPIPGYAAAATFGKGKNGRY